MTGSAPIPLDAPDDDHRQFKGVARILGPAWARMPTVTIGLLGVQIFWSVEMSYASPYLLSLGLSKSSMAVVFLAGPLSGLIMQPLIGILADNSTSRFGRRRPYMLLGTVVCALAMLLLGFTRPVASVFTDWKSAANDVLTIWLAVLAIYLIDFSINAVQALDRALLVDTLPPSDQPSGNAWAARMLGFGSVVGFFVGNVNLPRLFPFLGTSQLQVLSVIVSILLLGGHILMAILVKERILLPSSSSRRKLSFIQELKDIWVNIRILPHVIRQICIIQFFAWIAWFPVLFYSTIYVGDLHKYTSPVPTTADEETALDAEATRLGSRALFYSSILALVINLALPAFVTGTDSQSRGPRAQKGWEEYLHIPPMFRLQLATIWTVGHLIFASAMFSTFFVSSVWGATLVIATTGISWAITQWVPFSLLAEAILTEPAELPGDDNAGVIHLADVRRERDSEDREHEAFLHSSAADDDHEEVPTPNNVMGILSAQRSRINISQYTHVDPEDEEDFPGVRQPNGGSSNKGGSLSAKAGIILGIHNVFIVIPQFLVTGFSALLFALLDPQKAVLPDHHSPPVSPVPKPANDTILAAVVNSTVEAASSLAIRAAASEHSLYARDEQPQSNSVVYIFRIGGVAASVACVISWRLAQHLRHRR